LNESDTILSELFAAIGSDSAIMAEAPCCLAALNAFSSSCAPSLEHQKVNAELARGCACFADLQVKRDVFGMAYHRYFASGLSLRQIPRP